MMQGLELIKQKIRSAKEIVISGHINPDGDSIGSSLSLGFGMESLGKRVYMLSPDGVPKRYTRLPGAGRIKRKTNKAVDLAIAVDCGNKEMLGEAFATFKQAKDILEIDHHEFRRPFGSMSLVNSKAAAVGELIYMLLKKLNIDITDDIACNLLTSIIVETDSFRLPNVTPYTFEVCTKLMHIGVDFYKLVDIVFWSKTRESVILSGICLSRCKFMKNNRIAWSIVRQSDFSKVKGKDEDVDAVADELRAIQGVEIVALFREKLNHKLRVSLRSKDKINVADIAEYFGGGGHYDVAGCSIPNNPKSMRELLTMAEGLLK